MKIGRIVITHFRVKSGLWIIPFLALTWSRDVEVFFGWLCWTFGIKMEIGHAKKTDSNPGHDEEPLGI